MGEIGDITRFDKLGMDWTLIDRGSAIYPFGMWKKIPILISLEGYSMLENLL